MADIGRWTLDVNRNLKLNLNLNLNHGRSMQLKTMAVQSDSLLPW